MNASYKQMLKTKNFALFAGFLTIFAANSVAQASDKKWLWICKGDNWIVEIWEHPTENRVADLKFRNTDTLEWEQAQDTAGCLEETTDESGTFQTCLPSKIWESGYLIELQGNASSLSFGSDVLSRSLATAYDRTANVFERSFSGEVLVNESPLVCRYLPSHPFGGTAAPI